VPVESHFWQFLENLNPLLSAIVWTPKGTCLRHNACYEPFCVKIHPCVTSVGESGEKIKIRKKRPYISRISPDAPLRPIGTNFGLHVLLVGVINCAKFYRNRLRGLDSVRVELSYYPSHNNTSANVGLSVSPIGYAYNIINCPIRRMRDAMSQVKFLSVTTL